MERVAENIYVIRADERVCSAVYVLRDGGRRLIIDAGDGNAALGFEPEFCLLTHGHADHTFGVKESWKNVYLRHEDWIDSMPFYTPKNARDYDFEKMKFGKFALQIFHTPGHTHGSVSIFEKTNRILFSGDTKFAGGDWGRTDFHGGDEKAMMKSLKLIDSIDYGLLCPGHGEFEKK